MILKIVSLFLVVMAVLAMFGRLRFPAIPGVEKAKKTLGKLKRPGKCPKCGAFKVGKGGCVCEGGK